MAPRREFGPAVRRAALLRAKDRCELCGSKVELELHHIGNRGGRSLFNAKVLCAECHRRLHA
jgi:5-methylcytosine-specific restriction endonuclease McrA